jgi:hypothetical protein
MTRCIEKLRSHRLEEDSSDLMKKLIDPQQNS